MKLWGGRFSSQPDRSAIKLNASIDFDKRLGPQDVRGSAAWAGALHAAGILDEGELDALLQGLTKVGQELEGGSFEFLESDEDIHTAVERRLGELTGPLAGRLHTGRSRNDQVATDLRLWLLDGIPVLENGLLQLQQALVSRAEADMDLVLPGYTHTQRAQPVLLSHWWLSHFWPQHRDRQRLQELRRRTAVLPLGSGALAGAPFPVDRRQLAEDLGFEQPSTNSIDAVSDRDFAAEFLFWAALLGVHLSRLADAVILFSSSEFGFFELSDAYATGSSLMPQKKNPDVFELARGKAGTLIGALAGLLAVLKGLPSAYDKDLQEDKLPVFAAYDTLTTLLPVLAGALETLSVNSKRMESAIDPSLMATDLADYLVEKGVPFREAHGLSGQAVRKAAEEGVSISELPLSVFQTLHPSLGEDVVEVFDPRRSVGRRRAYGGTAPEAVREQLREAVQAARKSAGE
jgi:argininosuccinate lyase